LTQLAPWIPTPIKIVYEALDLAWVGPCDVVYDLGSGDGRVVVIAVRDFKAKRAVGVEVDPALVEVARAKAKMEHVDDRVEIIEDSFFNVYIGEATVVYLYLYKSINEQLKPKLEAELKPGTRVVAVDFPVPGWLPVRIRRVRDESDILRTIYLYMIGISDERWGRRGIVPIEDNYEAIFCR
jgi:SAM-dependent methyltransferase